MKYLTFGQAAALLRRRPLDSNKGDFGRLLCVCGSAAPLPGTCARAVMSGAAVLCGGAALRCGVGLLDMAVPQPIYPVVANALPEALYTVYGAPCGEQDFWGAVAPALSRATACVLGCGLSTAYPQRVLALLRACTVPLVLDADGLNCVAAAPGILRELRCPAVLTPHPGEMARLCGLTVAQVQADRRGAALAFARKYGVVLVLKGAGTLVAAPDGRLAYNPTGNPGMARGGSGDLLSGMVGAFVAQGAPLYEAACAAVYLHGLAGDRAASRLSQQAMLPRDMLAELPGIFLDAAQQA